MPAPANNKNHMHHGLTTGCNPPGCNYVTHAVSELRRAIEAAVITARGSVGLVDAAAIQTACRWERHALLCGRWLRKHVRGNDACRAAELLRDIANASSNRDKALGSLHLSKQPGDWYAAAIDARSQSATETSL